MKRINLIQVVFILLFLISCGSNTDSVTEPTKIPLGNLISNTECKANKYDKTLKYQNFEDAVEWKLENGTLTIKHINAAFNCCPGKISGLVKIGSGQIEINEVEEKMDCKCNCLYDLTYEINNIPTGIFNLIIHEPYVGEGDTIISFQINLNVEPEGNKVFARNKYPWFSFM